MTYGDDNIMTVRKGCDWYNHTSIANKFSDLGIEYTMADKEAKSVPYISAKDASFLKRTWRYDENLQCMLAPLEHDSIEKMLMVWNRSKSVSEGAQALSVIESALGEYFFYGKKIYNEKKDLLQEVVTKAKLTAYVSESTFLSYEDLVERFKKCSKHCEIYEEYFPCTLQCGEGERLEQRITSLPTDLLCHVVEFIPRPKYKFEHRITPTHTSDRLQTYIILNQVVLFYTYHFNLDMKKFQQSMLTLFSNVNPVAPCLFSEIVRDEAICIRMACEKFVTQQHLLKEIEGFCSTSLKTKTARD
jgi:hypothetical protein